MISPDYTQNMYRRLIESIAETYPTYSILDYVRCSDRNPIPKHFMIMRHDVDADIGNALSMARIENRRGIRATYYLRVRPHLYPLAPAREIARLGHEIGYHYEVMSDAKGNPRRAAALFRTNLAALRRIAPVQTACMHGRPLSKYNNLDFWKHHCLQEFDLVAEPYLSIDYSQMYYFTDTSGCWDNRRFNIRDVVRSRGDLHIRSTQQLIGLIRSKAFEKAAMLTHTNIWTNRLERLFFYKFAFFFLNRIKYLKKKAIYGWALF